MRITSAIGPVNRTDSGGRKLSICPARTDGSCPALVWVSTATFKIQICFERNASETIERLQASAEPALTVAMGILMLWIAVAVLGPAYDTTSLPGYLPAARNRQQVYFLPAWGSVVQQAIYGDGLSFLPQAVKPLRRGMTRRVLNPSYSQVKSKSSFPLK